MRRIALLLIALVICTFTSFSFSQQSGQASYYSHRLHGRKMSSGRPYHKDSLTCAHRTLPFGTLLEVRNKKNNKSVVVKVTDRGPYIRNRIIDLSYAAAKELNILHQGVAQVEIKEWAFRPFVPILLPFNRYGLFVPVKSTEEVLNNLKVDKEKVLK
ncbi:MAG: septal ring lytic transglycosylase RlpA family protein [Proteiniphilum sp.]|nr:septal ring lytic transglycosylase RlpA family protein [Proteiniphilum sp.]